VPSIWKDVITECGAGVATVPAEHWNSILSAVTEGVIAVDCRGNVVLSNPAARRILGEALSGGTVAEVLPLARALEGGTISDLEVNARGVRLSADILPVRDGTGAVAGAVAVFRDIAEREELRKFRRAVEQSPSSVMMTDLEGAIEYVNPKFTEVSGYSSEEVMGQNPRILKTGHLAPEHYECMWRDISSGREWRGEFLNKKKNGEVYWEDASLCPIVGPGGKVTHYIAVKHDITERKRMEEALRQANETLRLVIEASPVAIVTLDREAVVTSWNRAAETMFGWSEREAIARPLPIVRPERMQATKAAIGRVADARSIAGFETEYVRRDGKAVEAAVWQAPLSGPGGHVSGVLVLIADISEQRRLEERVRHVQKLDAIGTFAGGLAQDLTNLLAMVTGYAQMLGSSLPPGDRRYEQARQIAEAARRASTLMAELLAFSGRQTAQPKVFSPNELISSLEERLRRQTTEKVEIRIVVDPSLGYVRADPQQVAQAILKLVENAREAMPHGGTLTVATANVELTRRDLAVRPDLDPGPYVMIGIRDTGPGISAEARQHLFEPFFTSKSLGRGNGLGLSAVYGAVKQAGGVIRVSSESGQGTTFEIYLPRAERPL
jgi:nitrogen fixation negative regulator NifL